MVFDDLRRQIASGVLVPGERLLLRSIAQQFNCSEIPVREAFRSLAARGFVELVPHGGAHVSAPKVNEIAELTETRALLEPEATFLAAQLIEASDLRELDSLLVAMAAAADANASAEYGTLNRRFHDVILARCPNRKLVEVINDLWDRAERGRLVYLKGPEFIAESLSHHTEMVRLIRDRDFAALRNLSMRHSRFGLSAIRELADWEGPAALRRAGNLR